MTLSLIGSFFANRPAPTPFEPVMNCLNDMVRQNHEIVIFTDGSCIRPAHPWHRRAAFSVILSTSVTPESRTADVNHYKATTQIPGGFQTLAVAECQGCQTIPRAELQAVAFVANLGIKAVVYTDSA